jgi:hypothetical protein
MAFVTVGTENSADIELHHNDRGWDWPGRIDSAPFPGEIPRDNLAALLAGVLHDPRLGHRILYVNRGADPFENAHARALAGAS